MSAETHHVYEFNSLLGLSALHCRWMVAESSKRGKGCVYKFSLAALEIALFIFVSMLDAFMIQTFRIPGGGTL